ncbi:hypothetical protein X766_16020 [Mesorhizobium sp. LSJC255A00]|nr:hypothetical protein X766_16020 [Mesorhizobium sp. LSJC255A00]
MRELIMDTYYGVYRVLKNGEHRYVSRTCTSSKKLAEEIARDFTNGGITMPDGSTKRIEPHLHIAKPLPKEFQ